MKKKPTDPPERTNTPQITEARLQADCFQWHYNAFPQLRGLLFTVDNNATDGAKGGIRKAMGRVAGVSDMIYLYGGRCYCLEFKLPGKRQSTAQRDWQQTVEAQGIHYAIIESESAFRKAIHYIHQFQTV